MWDLSWKKRYLYGVVFSREFDIVKGYEMGKSKGGYYMIYMTRRMTEVPREMARIAASELSTVAWNAAGMRSETIAMASKPRESLW